MGTAIVRERGAVRYLEIRARSLVNKCTSPRMPFSRTVNPYRGCAMGCRYCYATYTHEFMGITTPEEFHSTVYTKVGGEQETEWAIAAAARRGERIALGTSTDPYQPGENEFGITRRFLEQVVRHRGVRLSITTKGAGILRDVELLSAIRARSSLSIHVSLISADAALLRELEPWAPPPDVRIEVMRRLKEAGLAVSLAMAPVLPALTDAEPAIDELFARVRAAGIDRLFYNILFLRSPTKEMYLRWLARAFPQLVEAYEGAYADRVYLGGRYRRAIDARVERLMKRHGLAGGHEDEHAEDGRPAQLRLWE
jgi:DNA repair photolyase